MSETVLSALQRASAMLGGAGISGAEGDARALLAHVLKIDRGLLSARGSMPLLPSQSHALDQVIAMRANNRPISHIIGLRAFWNHEFLVTSDVLDPRPDSEMLVAMGLEKQFSTLLDLGTGSGALVLSLLSEAPGATAVACDISDRALDVAQLNAARMKLMDRVTFVRSDWFSEISGKFDLIVCNPPYIATHEMDGLAADVRDWEPHLALTPGDDGLLPYRQMATRIAGFLNPNGRALFEVGYQQAEQVKQIFTESGHIGVTIHKDLNDHQRIVAINT